MSDRSRWQAYVFGGSIIVIGAVAAPDAQVDAFGFGNFLKAWHVVGFAFWGLLWAVLSTIGEVWSYFSRRFDRWPLDDARAVTDSLKHATNANDAVTYHSEPIDPKRLAASVESFYSELLSLDTRPVAWRRKELFSETEGFIARLEPPAALPKEMGLSDAQAQRIVIFTGKWKKLRTESTRFSFESDTINFVYSSVVIVVAFVLSFVDGLRVGGLVLCKLLPIAAICSG